MDLQQLNKEIAEFASERDWDKFHTPKNLTMALSVEVAELMEHFQWLTADESLCLNSVLHSKIKEEIGDVMIYLLRLGQKLDVDIVEAAFQKMETNRKKYPAEIVRGSSKKYNEY